VGSTAGSFEALEALLKSERPCLSFDFYRCPQIC
jgi:hypothetical protein